MEMKQFRKLVKETVPCKEGWEWFLRATRKHENTTIFFESLLKTKKAEKNWGFEPYNKYNNYSPHGYLIYLFRTMIDWSDVDDLDDYSSFVYSDKYHQFLKDEFGTENDFEIPIRNICLILRRSYHRSGE